MTDHQPLYLVNDYGEGTETSLDAFFLANDGFETSEIAEIRKLIAEGKTYAGGGGASPLYWLVPQREVKVGDRFVLTHQIDRYPHFSAAAGLTGTVAEISPMVAGKMDLHLPGAEEWDNEIMFGQTGETVDSLADFCWSTAPTDAPVAVPPPPAPPKYILEFPDFGPLDVTIPEGFEDRSWHNDACPCWISEDLHLRLMIDYADRSKSEADAEPIGPYLRFMVDRLTDDNQVDDTLRNFTAFATYDEALAVIIGEQFVAYLKDDLTVNEWEKMRRQNSTFTDNDFKVCASHDFCDANVWMNSAMEDLGFKLEGDWANERKPESKRLVALWNAAWTYAKRQHLTAPKG